LWYGVLAAHNGEDGGGINIGGRFVSVWWENLFGICEEVSLGVGIWFMDNLGRWVGDGSCMLFWCNPWLNEGVLKDSFSRLFQFS